MSVYTNVGNKVCYYLCYASMIIVAVMMVLMFVDSMLGLFFNSRIMGSYELVQVMLSILVFSSWAYTQTVHGHINVVMFIRLMPQKLRFVCYSITSILSTVTMVFATYGVWKMIQDKISNREATATLMIPYWPFYIFELLAFALMAIMLLCDALKSVAAIVDKDFADEIMSTWT